MLKIYTREQLKEILELHEQWLHDKSGERANLSNSDLRGFDFSIHDLRYANLSGANLSICDLTGLNLRGCRLYDSDLSYSMLYGANLRAANMSHANLRHSDLSNSDLSCADLRGSDLHGADISGSNLSFAKTDKKYIQISCIGSRNGMTTYCFDDDTVWCGCFEGTLEQFEARVSRIHADNPQHLKEYMGAITYFKSLK